MQHSLRELLHLVFERAVAYARANPKKVNMGNSGTGGISHLASAWLHSLAKVDVTYIPYKGAGPQLVDLMAGRLDLTLVAVLAAMPLIRSGKVHALAIMGNERWKFLPNLLTVSEQGIPEFNHSNWLGIVAPANTPATIINALSEGFNKVVRMRDVAERLEEEGVVMVGSTPSQFKQLIATEVDRWRKVVREAGISIEQ